MSRYKSAGCSKRSYVAQKIRAWVHHKQMAELIPENEHVFNQRPAAADAVVIIRIKGQPQMQFSSYKTPFGWSISPTMAGKKVQQVLMRA